MNKFIVFICLFMGVVFNSIAQKSNTSPQLSIGGEFGTPVSTASSVFGTAIGASVKLEVPLKVPGLSVTATAGINAFFLRFYYTGNEKNAFYLPFEFGAKYYFSKIAYVEGDAGFSSNLNRIYPESKTAFIFSPVIGVTAPTNHHKHTIDLGLRAEQRVESHRSITQLAIRLAYRFKV